jgi:hypothetical protein
MWRSPLRLEPFTLDPGEEIMVFPPDCRALVMRQSDCTLSTTDRAMLAPADTEQQKEKEFLKGFRGAYSEPTAPDSYAEISLAIPRQSDSRRPPSRPLTMECCRASSRDFRAA